MVNTTFLRRLVLDGTLNSFIRNQIFIEEKLGIALISLYATDIYSASICTLEIHLRILLLKWENDASGSTLLIEVLKITIIIFLLVICLYLWFRPKRYVRDPRCPCLLFVLNSTEARSPLATTTHRISLHLKELINPRNYVLLTYLCGYGCST